MSPGVACPTGGLRYRCPFVDRLRKVAFVRKRAVGMGLVLVAMMATAACGGDDDGDDGEGAGGTRLTQAELATRGDAVCNRLDAAVKQLANEFEPSITFTPEQMQQLFQKLVPVVDTAITDFEELEPPENLEAKYDEALQQAADDRERLVAASESQESARMLFEGGQDPFTATNEKLAAVGITACSDDEATTEGDAEEGAGGTTEESTTPEDTTTSAP